MIDSPSDARNCTRYLLPGISLIVPATGTTVDPDELVAWSKETMANYKAPRRVIVLDELPEHGVAHSLKGGEQGRLPPGERAWCGCDGHGL